MNLPSHYPRLILALLIAHLLLIVGGELCSAEAAPISAPGMDNIVLPADAKQLLTVEANAEAQAKATYDAALAKLRKELVPKLQKAQESATRKGDLDGAMAVKKALEEMGAGKGKAPGSFEAMLEKIPDHSCIGGAGKSLNWALEDNGRPLMGLDLAFDEGVQQISFIAPVFEQKTEAGKGLLPKDTRLTGAGPVIAIIGCRGKDGFVGGLQLVFQDTRGIISLSKWYGAPAASDDQKQVLYADGKPLTKVRVAVNRRVELLSLE